MRDRILIWIKDRYWNWLLLVLCLALAFACWTLWMTEGIAIVHQRVSSIARLQSTAPATAVSAPDHAATLTEFGQTGDAFGGANALFAAIAGAVVLWAGILQSRSLREAQEAYDHERLARKHEQFEALFFRMLDLSRELTERIETRPSRQATLRQQEGTFISYERKPKKAGAAALDVFANTIHNIMQKRPASDDSAARDLVELYLDIYSRRPSALGPYFRLLFQTFKLIDNSGLSKPLQIQYANIARGQISDGAVLLLALNGLTQNGHKFIRYIEQFGLLEHMLIEHRIKYAASLSEGYRARAFMGSDEREGLPHVLEPLNSDPRHFQRKGLGSANFWENEKEAFDEIGSDS